MLFRMTVGCYSLLINIVPPTAGVSYQQRKQSLEEHSSTGDNFGGRKSGVFLSIFNPERIVEGGTLLKKE
jgi:hypothetical protein